MNVVGFETEHDRDDPMAQETLRILADSYPGHDWYVLIRGGILQIRNMSIHPHWGFALHYSQIKSDAGERKKSIIRAAGEYLERANRARGRKNDDAPVLSVEGIPDRDLKRNALC